MQRHKPTIERLHLCRSTGIIELFALLSLEPMTLEHGLAGPGPNNEVIDALRGQDGGKNIDLSNVGNIGLRNIRDYIRMGVDPLGQQCSREYYRL